MLSTSQEGRGYPAGTMGARFTARGIPAGDEGAPIGLPEAVEVVRPDAVRGVVAHGVKLLRSGRGRADLQGLKRSARVGLCGVSAHGMVVCSAPDVLAGLPARIKREKKGKKGKERK